MKSPVHEIHKMPLLIVTACFLAGIIIHQFYFNWILFTSLWLICMILVVTLTRTKQYSIVLLKVSNILFPLLILLSGGITSEFQKSPISEITPISKNYYGFVIEEIKSETTYNDYLVHLSYEFSQDTVTKLNETIHFRGFDTIENKVLKPGSTILFTGVLNRIENRGNPGEFDYQEYMANQNIYYNTTCFNSYITTPKQKTNLKIAANYLRSKLISKFHEYQISEKSASLLSALTLGDKKLLSKDTKNSFADSGAMHVLAVSGLHVGILFVLFSYLLNFLFPQKRLKIIKLILLILILWFYAFLTGLAPSVMRSCTMFTLIAIGENLKRKGNIYNSIGASALILMLLNTKVIFEVGFQLSYLALFAIIYFQPKIANLIQIRNKPLQKIWQLTSVSLAAQIGTAPIAIYYFHQFPVYFWLSNLIVIPAAAIILYSTFAFLLSSGIPIVASKIALILDEFVSMIMDSIQVISNLPHSTINNIYISNFSLIASYLIFLGLILFISFQHKKYIFFLLSSFCLLLSAILIQQNKLQNNRKLIIYNTYEPFLISILDGKNHYYVTNKDSINSFEKSLLQQTSGINRSKRPKNLPSNNRFQSKLNSENLVLKVDTLTLNIEQFSECKKVLSNTFNIQIKYTNKQLFLNEIKNTDNTKVQKKPNKHIKPQMHLQSENKAFIIDF